MSFPFINIRGFDFTSGSNLFPLIEVINNSFVGDEIDFRSDRLGRRTLFNRKCSRQAVAVSKKSIGVCLRPRLRVVWREEIALGPGKVELLRFVAESGSIREAADRMGMSYMRAWTLIRTMNACFKEPLVEAARGGSEHGGATLSETGKRALKLYEQMEKDCLAATKAKWAKLKSLLR